MIVVVVVAAFDVFVVDAVVVDFFTLSCLGATQKEAVWKKKFGSRSELEYLPATHIQALSKHYPGMMKSHVPVMCD